MVKNLHWPSCFYSKLLYGIHQYFFLIAILIRSSSGGLESNIICRFDKRNESVFWTGEFVTGKIEYVHLNSKELKLKSIGAELIGELVYTTNTPSGGTTNSSLIFFEQRVTIDSVSDQSSFLLTYGNHKWPFGFFINHSLAPSLERTGAYDPFIRYFIRVVFVRPEWYRWNIKKIVPIVVKHASLPVTAMQSEAQKKNRHDVHLHIILQKRAILAGTNVSFDVYIRNPQRALIRRFSIILFQYLELGPAETKVSNLIAQNVNQLHQFR
ncbi:unnamed protein product, partial [Rotaria socialis]